MSWVVTRLSSLLCPLRRAWWYIRTPSTCPCTICICILVLFLLALLSHCLPALTLFFPGSTLSQDAASLLWVLVLSAPTLLGSHHFPPSAIPSPLLISPAVSFGLSLVALWPNRLLTRTGLRNCSCFF